MDLIPKMDDKYNLNFYIGAPPGVLWPDLKTRDTKGVYSTPWSYFQKEINKIW